MNLLATVALLVFSSGRWVVPLAAWLAPLFLLRFVRRGGAASRLVIAAVVLYAVGCFTYWGIVPVPVPAYFAILLTLTLPGVLPYVADRLIRRRDDGFEATLIFPSAWVVVEYVISRTSPYGTWGSVAYTQVDHLPLIQSVAVTGLWGIAFLMAWTASAANWAWERGFEWTRVRAGVLTWAGTLAAVLLLGGARLALVPPDSPTLRVATFTVPTPERLSPWDLIRERREGAALEAVRAELHMHHDSLFASVRREAAAGARLVVWSEVNAFVLTDEAQAFEQRAASVAREAGVTLVTGIALFTPGQGYYENLLVAFDSSGTRLARYHKARPVPGDHERGADAAIPVFDTPHGRIAGAVCFDGDFVDLIAKAGRERVDLLVIPSSDWRAIDPIHTRMALLRGVENGCAVVRPTNQGLSAAADHQGRLLATADYFRARPNVMVAQVPVRGVRTFYARYPDLLPWICAGWLVLWLVPGLKRKPRN